MKLEQLLTFNLIQRPKANFGGEDLYPTLGLKAAALVHSLLLNHQLVDGNKRTAVVSMIEFLELNNKSFVASQKDVVDFAPWVENKKPKLEAIAVWIEKHIGK